MDWKFDDFILAILPLVEVELIEGRDVLVVGDIYSGFGAVQELKTHGTVVHG